MWAVAPKEKKYFHSSVYHATVLNEFNTGTTLPVPSLALASAVLLKPQTDVPWMVGMRLPARCYCCTPLTTSLYQLTQGTCRYHYQNV
jgi:hypothetical protein